MSYIAKGLLPYRGLGSGIKRALEDWPEIDFADLVQSVGIKDRAIKKQIEKLKIQGRIRRIGPDKGGHWEVVE